MAIAVALALTFLFITQLRYVIRNRNGIEDYIRELLLTIFLKIPTVFSDGKSLNMRKVHEGDDEEEIEWIKSLGEWTYPYDLGWKRNLREVFIGIFDGRTRGNGTWWPVVNGCTQFTFTVSSSSLNYFFRMKTLKFFI